MASVQPIPCSLILAGGLALGAYQAGALKVILDCGRFDVQAVAGTSIGAMNAAILAGNAGENRLAKIEAFWDAVATDPARSSWFDPLGLADGGAPRHLRNWAHVALSRLGGAPHLFRPRWPGERERGERGPSLYSSAPARALLAELIDFDRLNGGSPRLCIALSDIEAGEAVLFDTHDGQRITLDHVIASGSLLPAFAPVAIDGRLLADGGFAMNAPLEPFLASDRQGADWPIAILLDLFSPDAPPPASLEASVARSTDLQFAMQTQMRLAGIGRERALEARLDRDAPGVDLFHLSYRPLPHEAGSEKTYDFSRATIRDRMEEGERDARACVELLDTRGVRAAPGLRVHRVRRPEAR